MSSAPPPGWYRDPSYPLTERWWDGAAWTDHRRQPEVLPVLPVPPVVPPQPPDAGGSPRAKAVALGRWVLALADAWLVPLGFTIASPRDDDRRGGHVTLRHPDAERLSRVLIENGVLIDFRRPDGIRFGLSPLTTGFAEVREAMARVRELAG